MCVCVYFVYFIVVIKMSRKRLKLAVDYIIVIFVF